MVNMHVYLPEKYRSPFLHGVFLFSKVGMLAVNFDGFFALAYSSHILWSWPLGRTWCHHTSLSSALYLKGCQFCPVFFLERESWSQPYQAFFDCPQAWSYPQVFKSGLGMRLYEGRFGQELFSCRNFGISKLFQTQKSFWHWFKANSFWKNSSDSYGEVSRSDENFLFCFWWKTRSDICLVTKGLNFNLKVIENRFSKHLFYLHE